VLSKFLKYHQQTLKKCSFFGVPNELSIVLTHFDFVDTTFKLFYDFNFNFFHFLTHFDFVNTTFKLFYAFNFYFFSFFIEIEAYSTQYGMYEIMKPKHVKNFMKSKQSGTQNS